MSTTSSIPATLTLTAAAVRDVAQTHGVPMEEWCAIKRRRRREGWEHIKAVWAYSDQQMTTDSQREQQQATLAQQRLEHADALEREQARASRSERQRRLNERTRAKLPKQHA